MRTTTSVHRDDVARATAGGRCCGGCGAGTPGGPVRSLRVSLPGDPRAASAARQFVRAAFADWSAQGLPGAEGLTDRLADEAVLLVSELVTNAVVHAGTAVELRCRLEEAGHRPEQVAYPEDSAEPDASPGFVPGADDPDDTLPDSVRGDLHRAGVVIEVSDHHSARPVRGHEAGEGGAASESGGHGLQLVGAVAESWGITYRHAMKTVWFRLPAGAPEGGVRPELEADFDSQLLQHGLRAAELLAPAPRRATRGNRDAGWIDQGALSFLAEASDLLSGQLDADQVASLAAQLTVPRLADWCAVWLYDDGDGGAPGRGIAGDAGTQRLARVWHSHESLIDSLRTALEKQPPVTADSGTGGLGSTPTATAWPWPHDPGGYEPGGAALACPLEAGGRRLGTLLLGRSGLPRFPDEVLGLVEDLCRRVARAVATARAYRHQERISQVLQRRLLPPGRALVPGVASAVVYEPREGAWAGGDFWDLFEAGDGRWCFALGDVCGSGPEAAAVTGLARPVLRMLARDGFNVSEVLDRLNRTMAREAADSVAAVAAAVAAAGAGAEAPVELRDEGEQARFLSLLYGEIVPYQGGSGGARCTLASAGHPLPLVLGVDGAVRVAAAPQMLLGVVEDASYVSESFDLCPGETLLCVTDGVTERRSGRHQFDDEDGLAKALAATAGRGATAIAEHLRNAVHAFAPNPPDDDLALLVLQAAAKETANRAP
ncbi:SpoIIE family protein phosphatase [Streptomyces halobius]|uniref:SpoIIE family protein phosphatase n=1 Tax=Streptomyces halobius TaxID=2879846 RepID=A0ABY4MCI5_9ACTN|nr:SpoIIE family protein phosphatase [Streptomyces halobius]UQA95442.1 SpoIIE family protein phosphatase [Streptomyces halobius]